LTQNVTVRKLFFREQICSEISSVLTKRRETKSQLEDVLAKYPGILLNESLLALIRSKVLKKKFKDYFLACLSGMVFLQEDPAMFCKFLSDDEKLKEFNSVENAIKKLNPGIHQNYDEFCGIVEAMRILSGIKINISKLVELTEFLAGNRGREKIASKILSQSLVKQRFNPLEEKLAFSDLIFDLLVTFFSF